EVGPDRGAGRAARAQQRAVRQRDLEADDDVLDLAVPRRQLPGAAAGEPPADGRDVDRLRPVPTRETVTFAQLRLERRAERSREHVDGERHAVDVDDAIQAGRVE